MRTKFITILLCAFCLAANLRAQDNPKVWVFTEVSHTFGNGIYLTGYLEHDNAQMRTLECNYGRFSVGWNALPWLKFGINYVPSYKPEGMSNYMELDLVGTLKSGNFKVSVRERWRHGVFGTDKNELRSRLKVAYSIPGTKFGVSVAPEVFTWGTQWTKTRHYVNGTWQATDFMGLEWFYMYYAFNGAPAEQVVGFGLNFSI